MPEDPWYRDGLRFRCTQCGKCCTGEPGFVWLDDAEIDAFADNLRLDRAEFLAVYAKSTRRGYTLREKPNNDCIFYDRDQGCTVYELRPRQCRTWPFWESNIALPEVWQHTCTICPGSGQGDLISAEEITRRMKVIRL